MFSFIPPSLHERLAPIWDAARGLLGQIGLEPSQLGLWEAFLTPLKAYLMPIVLDAMQNPENFEKLVTQIWRAIEVANQLFSAIELSETDIEDILGVVSERLISAIEKGQGVLRVTDFEGLVDTAQGLFSEALGLVLGDA